MQEMVYLKADAQVAKYYDEKLVPTKLQHLGGFKYTADGR
jgi:hypothetical protein